MQIPLNLRHSIYIHTLIFHLLLFRFWFFSFELVII